MPPGVIKLNWWYYNVINFATGPFWIKGKSFIRQFYTVRFFFLYALFGTGVLQSCICYEYEIRFYFSLRSFIENNFVLQVISSRISIIYPCGIIRSKTNVIFILRLIPLKFKSNYFIHGNGSYTLVSLIRLLFLRLKCV